MMSQPQSRTKLETTELACVLNLLLSASHRADRQLWVNLDDHLRRLNKLTTIDLLNGALEELETAGVHAKLFSLLQTPDAEQHSKTVELSTYHLNRCIATIQVAKLLSHEILEGVPPQSTSYVLRVS
jgi:hypothetical protein